MRDAKKAGADWERFNREIIEAFEEAKVRAPASRFTSMRPVALPIGFRQGSPPPE